MQRYLNYLDNTNYFEQAARQFASEWAQKSYEKGSHMDLNTKYRQSDGQELTPYQQALNQ